MKINKITLNEYKPFLKDTNKNTPAQPEENKLITTPILNAYKDYNINFRGRTPENFYEQEFNIKYMPQTMKEFLNSEYEERKHIPPEQLISESFKFLAVTDNFADVKSTYPKETLFNNLHEASLKGRSGILSDIKLAKEMSDTPLIKDGTDHLGIYLLRKIYLEGKTIKEINKDFYEKDLNPAYKGIVTQPITYGTTSAYGIQYPKTDFWNSFIATRDEYKKFFVNLPKQNKADLKKELQEIHNKTNSTKEHKPVQRKYKIKSYQKEQIKKEIIKTKGDEAAIKKAITKRFSKDDPEAAFIVKYLSPIMTIAADKLHLSEEMKSFAQKAKDNNTKIDNFFAQFWKTHPQILEQYSTAITDTIDLFEETYENGGLLPINNEYQIITPDTTNQKVIDQVPQRFSELLDYVQTIVPNREKRYLKHDEEQNKWNEHFLWRYGEIPKEEKLTAKETEPQKTTLELLNESAKANKAKVYTLKDTNGNPVYITADLDETLHDYISKEYVGFPSNFIRFLTKKALKSPFMTEDAKLSFAIISLSDKLDEDERILGETECKYILKTVASDVNKELATASMATLDSLAKRSKEPQKIYRTMFANHQEEDTNEYSTILLKNYGEKDFEKELNNLYELYKKPLTTSETIKITNIIMDYIRNFDLQFASTDKSVFYKNKELINGIHNFKEKSNLSKEFQKALKKQITNNVPILTFSKTLLMKTINPDLHKAKIETILNVILNNMMNSVEKIKRI